ncbi:MAG TPA: choice-of-anchor J domain-containing protein, partial [Pyrinomonadaceae bacterium]
MSLFNNIMSSGLDFFKRAAILPAVLFFLLAGAGGTARAQFLNEGFNNISTLPASGWHVQNNSSPVGSTGWFQGNPAVFPAQSGATNSYIGANFNNTTGNNTISNWLLTPTLNLYNGAVFKFWTRTGTDSPFPDRLEVRLSTGGASTNVGAG